MRVRVAFIAVVLACCAASPAAAEDDAPGLVDALAKLDSQLQGKGSLTLRERDAVHAATSGLILTYYGASASGAVTYADVLRWLDCADVELQRARNATRADARRALVSGARRCLAKLASKLRAQGSPTPAMTSDLAAIRARVAEIATAVRRGKAFGAKATAVRRLAAAFVKRHFDVVVLGVSVAEAFADIECVDVKVEAGRTSGASSCARRLRRLVSEKLPPAAPVTWGSDLAGTPVAIGGRYDEDTETWTKGVTAPVSGRITQFRLKVGAGPVELPVRFSVVRPQPDGTVKVITTTNPPYTLPAGAPGTYTFETSALSFACCKVQQGDIVTVDNRGNPADSAYVWFAALPGVTTLLHTGAPNQDAGSLWTGTALPGYEVLLQVVEQPG